MAMARKEPKAKRKGGLPEFVTSIDLGAHLGVTSKRVQQLSQEGVLERLGHLPEVFDGDPPHRAGGCVAQAWSVGEVLRAVLKTGG